MRLLLMHRYFWPDGSPYGQMLRSMAGRFAKEGYAVTVLSAQPSYHNRASEGARPGREEVDGAFVLRMPLLPERAGRKGRRLINMGLFLVRVFAHLCAHRYDLVVFASMPPVILGVVVRLALSLRGRGTRYIYHLQDIYPEAALAAGLVSDGPGYRLARRLDTVTCRRAAAVVVLSGDMRRTLAARGVDGDCVRVINNFSLVTGLERGDSDTPQMPARRPGDLVVLFAGNIGRFQGLELLIDAAHRLSDELLVQFWIMGAGAAKATLVTRAGPLLGRSVHFLPFEPAEKAFAVMRAADLGVVSLRAGLFRVAYPSKTMTYLAAGCRLVVVAEPESELVQTIVNNDLGVWSPHDDADALATVLREEARRRNSEEARQRATAFAIQHYWPSAVLDRWVALLGEVGRPVSRQEASGSLPDARSTKGNVVHRGGARLLRDPGDGAE